jgi:phage tail-like protein
MADPAPAPAPQSQPAAQASPVRAEPYRNYNFKLDVGGDVQGHFTECGGIGIKVPVIRYREGGERQIVRALPSRPEYGEVTLRYGLTESRALFDWFMRGVTQGAPEPKNVSIIMLANDGFTEVTRWNLEGAWPTEWRGAALDALGREIAIETLTLVFEGLIRDGQSAQPGTPAAT